MRGRVCSLGGGGSVAHDFGQALTALGRLAHRGAVAADGKSSDGVGVTTAVPRALLLRETGFTLREEQALAVGMLFLPAGEMRAEALLERCLASHDLKVLGWREVPVQTGCLGEIALSTMPQIRQVLVVDGLERQPEGLRVRRGCDGAAAVPGAEAV